MAFIMIWLGVGEKIWPRETYWWPIVVAQAQTNDESRSFFSVGPHALLSSEFSGEVY